MEWNGIMELIEWNHRMESWNGMNRLNGMEWNE